MVSEQGRSSRRSSAVKAFIVMLLICAGVAVVILFLSGYGVTELGQKYPIHDLRLEQLNRTCYGWDTSEPENGMPSRVWLCTDGYVGYDGSGVTIPRELPKSQD